MEAKGNKVWSLSGYSDGPHVVCCGSRTPPPEKMKRTYILSAGTCFLLFASSVLAQTAPAPAPQQPVSYASVTQLNGLLSQLDATSKSTQADLQKVRIEKWKADGATKKQALANVDSIQRNLQGALPEILGQLRSNPEDVPATFKLYRNLDALYDVLGSVVESTGAFGSKDDLQALSNDLNSFESTRRQLAERITNLAAAKEQEIARLRTDLRAAQAAAEPPKKVVVDDTEPVKKPVSKKKKSSTASTTSKPKPDAGSTQNPQ